MKNVGISMGILAMMVLISCGKKEDKTTEVNTTETTVEKTVVVDTVVAKPATPQDGTTVKVGSDGVQIKSKDGTNSTSVEVKK